MPPIADDDARREISKRKRAGQLDDDILDHLVGQGLAEGHSRFLIATTVSSLTIPPCVRRFLEHTRITTNQASSDQRSKRPSRRMMIGMLVDASFDEGAAALVVSHACDQRHRFYCLDEVLGSHRPRGGPEVAATRCLPCVSSTDQIDQQKI